MENQLQELLTAQKEQAELVLSMKSELAQLKSVPVAGQEEKEAKELKVKFYNMVKSGDGLQGTSIAADGKVKAAQIGEKGDTILQDINTQIISRITASSILVGLFGRERTSSNNYVRKVKKGNVSAYWDGDAKTSGAPELVDVSMKYGKVISTPVVSNDTIADSFFDVESFLIDEVGKEIGTASAIALLAGDGLKKPLGLIKHFDKTEGVKSVEARDVTMFRVMPKVDGSELIDNLRNMTIELPQAYAGAAKFAMSVAAFEKVSAEKDTTGHSFVQKDVNGSVAGRIHGYDIIVDRLLPTDAPIMFGDFASAFAIVELPASMQMQRNPFAIEFSVKYEVGMRVGAITKANDSLIGFYL